MKTFFILLLGFGGLYPTTCSKESKRKQSEHVPVVKPDSTRPAKQFALFAPTVVIKQQRTAKA